MVSVKAFHTFGLNAKVAKVVEIEAIDQLNEYVGKKLGKDFILIGEGSNTVFLSNYQNSLLIMKMKGIEVDENTSHYEVKVSAGESWHAFVQYCLQHQIYGLENLALIPGSVGACPVQNIGAYGVEINKFITEVSYFDLEDGKVKQLSNKDCRFTYRNSIFKNLLKDNAVITSVKFALPKAWAPVVSYGELSELEKVTPEAIFNKVIEIRQSKLPDPNEVGNSGSFFKNPIVPNIQVEKLKQLYPNMPVYPWCKEESKLAAGWLIDQSGLKGHQHGTVAIHEKQALVLINKTGEAITEDLVSLIAHIKHTVAKKFGVELEPEVRMFAETGEVTFDQLSVETPYGQ